MRVNNLRFKTIWSDNSKKIIIIDQTYLPFNFVKKELKTLNCAVEAIRNMRVRGAPLIGVTAAYGIFLALKECSSDEAISDASKKLISTRPTAINLKWAVDIITNKLLKIDNNKRELKAFNLAQKLSNEDEEINKKIGEFGSDIIEKIYKNQKSTVNILTHCNAGWLATVDWGTATAPIYKARDKGIPIHVWVDETRPRNQGSFLTSWELKNEKIDHTIISDNTGGHLMQRQMVDMVITGSDRTTYTGDVCNKIGTYLKALAASDNSIPFYVALPSSTIDWENNDGRNIVIEERSSDEVHFIRGLNSKGNLENLRITPFDTKVNNYAFDVTPSKYITGLITEYGILNADEEDISRIKKIK